MSVYDRKRDGFLLKRRQRPSHETARARTLALWLMENADQIDGPENLQIVFNCAGKSVNVELKRRQKIDAFGVAD